jgi:hypothetical protein
MWRRLRQAENGNATCPASKRRRIRGGDAGAARHLPLRCVKSGRERLDIDKCGRGIGADENDEAALFPAPLATSNSVAGIMKHVYEE